MTNPEHPSGPDAAAQTPPLDDGLTWTRRFAGGLRNDLRRRLPLYLDDYKQGIHPKVLASTLFLFFACLANAIAFGGLTEVVTNGQIGVSEMILATAVGGVVFAVFGGQPLTILGGTGPIVIFTGLLYMACEDLEIDFLSTYAWTGLWSGGFLVLLSVCDASALMRFFTRFTDEIFAALIAVIFVVEAVKDMALPFTEVEAGGDYSPALLGMVLSLGTYLVSKQLKTAAQTRFLWEGMRNFLSDFGPAIAIAAMTGVALTMPSIELAAPKIPTEFGTTSGRPWVVDLFAVPTWAIFAAALPALMATILLFLDQNITTRLVNSPTNKLAKGPAYHLDLLVVGLIIAACSLLALPWIVAATVHALNHVRSLATVKVVEVGGVKKEVIDSVRENRVSGLSIHLLIGVSILFLGLIKMIPMSVLFGLFLFMGFNTLGGNQFWDRVTLWVTDPKLYPQTHYVTVVRHAKIHLFTAVQAGALVALWILKTSKVGILFPVLIALLVPLRILLGRFYSDAELHALDAEEELEQIASDKIGGDLHS
ncbi:MAG: sodium bicarbonate transporter family protein [Planctomycetota bacterium]